MQPDSLIQTSWNPLLFQDQKEEKYAYGSAQIRSSLLVVHCGEFDI